MNDDLPLKVSTECSKPPAGHANCVTDVHERHEQDVRREEALRVLVQAVTHRNLEVPALFLLEAAQPFHLLVQQVLFLAQPLLRPWLGDELLLWAAMLEDASALEQAAQRLATNRRSRV